MASRKNDLYHFCMFDIHSTKANYNCHYRALDIGIIAQQKPTVPVTTEPSIKREGHLRTFQSFEHQKNHS